MTKHRLHKQDAKNIRDTLNQAYELAASVHKAEHELIDLLVKIDEDRFYTRYGYKTLKGFCIRGLQFSKNQSQRLVTNTRRASPRVQVGI